MRKPPSGVDRMGVREVGDVRVVSSGVLKRTPSVGPLGLIDLGTAKLRVADASTSAFKLAERPRAVERSQLGVGRDLTLCPMRAVTTLGARAPAQGGFRAEFRGLGGEGGRRVRSLRGA